MTTLDAESYEGRLRFGGDQEAFWGDYFNGFKDGNPWVDQVPDGVLDERRGFELLGIRIGLGRRRGAVRRQLMARFGDISRLVARDRDLWVTLKSGTTVNLDRYAADDFADGVRVWDRVHGIVDLDEGRIRSIEFLPSHDTVVWPANALHGTVRTRNGDRFSGRVQWDRTGSTGTDEIEGYTGDETLSSLTFATIASIARTSPAGSVVTLLDGSEVVLSGTRDVDEGNAGLYVDDMRYGRVLIPWQAFDRIDFRTDNAGSDADAPSYDDYPAGRPLMGTVTTRAGQRITGRLVYDLDESEVTETLDAPSRGVDYTIPFGLVESILLIGADGEAGNLATVVLLTGEILQLERSGDLGAANAGMLIFVDDGERTEYVPWAEVGLIDLERAPAMYPPIDSIHVTPSSRAGGDDVPR